MNSDFTQQQTLGELEKAEQLSRQAANEPPAEIPGLRIEKLLGQGAFGQVWLGRDLNTGRQVAIKFYLYRGGVDWSLLDREVKHLVNMSTGRYIVQVLGVGWESDPPYYVMEYLENGSLEDLIRSQGVLGVQSTVSILQDIADGLSFAHSKGVLHCDLKPANVMMDHDWRPRIADFGQSRMTDEQTPSLGTLFFMAPEQADLEASPDTGWDVYALGAIAYCMLVGSPPYRTPEMVETLDTAESLIDRLDRYRRVIRKSPPPRLHHQRKNVDKDLCQIIDRCLAPDPKERYANVEQVLTALEQRNSARSRRPLLLLGILGPILFLVVMLLFSARSIGVAKKESLQQTMELSLKSNQFAAQLAAKTLESEIARLFSLIEQEAQRSELRTRLIQLQLADSNLFESLASGTLTKEESTRLREQLSRNPKRTELQSFISNRLAQIISQDSGGSGALFNTLFVNDALGNNLAIEYSDPSDAKLQNPIGRNFAHRSYFLGTRFDRKGAPKSELLPTRHTHLSAAFRSTATGQWKIGISAPIWPLDAESPPAESELPKEPLGVLVLTIDLGDLKLLPEKFHDYGNEPSNRTRDRFAALVDGREGNGQGTLLQHPYLDSEAAKLPDAIVPRIGIDMLSKLKKQGGILDYVDPSSKTEDGQEFQGQWIAAMERVRIAASHDPQIRKSGESDLWVVVQERGSKVAAPVVQLGSRLQSESYIELAAVVIVMLALWYFVFVQSNSTTTLSHHVSSVQLSETSAWTGETK